MKPIQCQGVISTGFIYDLRFTIYAPTANGFVNRKSPIVNLQTFAAVAFCIVTADAPMFGRWPLCHHSTNALAM